MSDGMSQCGWCGYVCEESDLRYVERFFGGSEYKELCPDCFYDYVEGIN